MKVFSGVDDLAVSEGHDLGYTEWLHVDQDRVDQFAAATGDHQWIHVDVARAASGPYGQTIAHGLLTLSLLPHFLHQLYAVENVAHSINYGFDKVRFITPVLVGSRLRAHTTIVSAVPIEDAVQVLLSTMIETDRATKPACAIESVVRYVAQRQRGTAP